MLNLGLKVDVDIKKLKMPIHFERKNECVHCGAVGTLDFVDIFGNVSRREINAFDHIKCSKCGRVYSILWQPEPDDYKKMFPSAVEPDLKRDFSNLILNRSIREEGTKKLD